MADNEFTSPYIPNTSDEQAEMLQAIGLSSVEDLFEDIPKEFRNPTLRIPPPSSEMEVIQHLHQLSELNVYPGRYPSFIGAGVYRHFTPAVVSAIVNRGEFLTSYTPYQAEASQGTLQAAFEFQSMSSQLMDMQVANAGMYDGASSFAEAALMACRVTQRSKVAILDTVSPNYAEVVQTYTEPQGIETYSISNSEKELRPGTACLLVQSPNFFGYLENIAHLTELAHGLGALMCVSTDPIAMGMFKSPGSFGVDIATGEGQALGVPSSFGGPYVGIFTCKQEFFRQMPGRISGRTVDTKGRVGYVLTLQTREQHIRRERATSNICTSTALIALMATIYVACLGKHGIRRVAELCYHKAHYAASEIQRISGYDVALDGTFFQEFVVRCPKSPREINAALQDKGIIGGLDISDQIPNGMLLCFTEVNSKAEIDSLISALEEMN